jgi:hypothetical protein
MNWLIFIRESKTPWIIKSIWILHALRCNGYRRERDGRKYRTQGEDEKFIHNFSRETPIWEIYLGGMNNIRMEKWNVHLTMGRYTNVIVLLSAMQLHFIHTRCNDYTTMSVCLSPCLWLYLSSNVCNGCASMTWHLCLRDCIPDKIKGKLKWRNICFPMPTKTKSKDKIPLFGREKWPLSLQIE